MQQPLTRQQRRAAERKAVKAQRKQSATANAPAAAQHPSVQPAPGVAPARELSSLFVTQIENHATEAQLTANRANAKLSTGPTSDEGKAIVSRNHLSHGLTGKFTVLEWEDESEYLDLLHSLHAEHQPTSETETRLVDAIARHFWLTQRALNLQDELLMAPDLDQRRFSLYLRYQTTNERAYYRAQRELATIRKEKRREQIGFESQKRAQELHDARLRLTNARAVESEIENEVRCTMEAPLPGHTRVPLTRENTRPALASPSLPVNSEANLDQKAAA